MSSSRLSQSSILPAAALIGIACIGTNAQTAAPRNEEFDLNIDHERITETDFARSLSALVRTDKVFLEAGAAVSASRIDVTIRNATGHIRFRSALESLEQLFRRP